MVKITLDAETFKALASTTRLTVLRALDQRRKTLTELARDLELNKATVHEHLQLLASANLIRKRDDEGRKWIYYELTWQGQRLMHPQETTTFNVLLGLGILAAGGGVTMLGRALGWWLEAHQGLATENSPTGLSPNPKDANQGAASPAASPAPPASGTATNGPSASGGAPPQPPNDATPDSADGAASSNHAGTASASSHSFLDDGGLLALVLLCMTALFVGLALLLRRQVRPGRFSRRAAEAAEKVAGKPGGVERKP